MMNKKRSMSLDMISTSLIVMAGRVVGFVIPFVIAAIYGTSYRTDAFFLSFGLILVLTLVIGHLLETLIIPYVTAARARKGDVGVLVGGIMVRMTAVLFLFMAVLMLILKPVLGRITQFPPDTVELAFRLALEMAPMVFLVTCTSGLNGALNAYKKFSVAALSPIFRSVAVIASILYFKDSFGIHAIAWGFTFGEGLRFLVSLYFFQTKIGGLKLDWKMKPGVSQFFKSAAFQVLGFAFLYFVPVVSQVMASWLEPGDVSIFTLAERLRNVPFLVFSAGIASVVLSHWANDYSRAPEEFVWHRIQRVILKCAGAAALGTLVMIFCSGILVSLALGWGSFPQDKMSVVSNLFCLFILSFPFDVVALLCIRIIIIFKNDVFYMIVTFWKLILMGILNYVLMKPYGLLGIGAATAGMNIIYAAVLFYYVRNQSRLREKEFEK